ncbi:helix-turn-helix domain-containing protein [Amycolatopsis sp. NPDC059657]|uniref:helix-turn-helix domain-containing protein n=1 Tax=Amycolatopsis sp. NPDC059657 TaxID=3346899 RepID=UPI00366FB4D3
METTARQKGTWVVGSARTRLGAALKKRYAKGSSIRCLADETGRSYGFVHRILAENGVQFRGRGGDTRSMKRTTR